MRLLKRSVSFETTEEVDSSRKEDCKRAKWTISPKLITASVAWSDYGLETRPLNAESSALVMTEATVTILFLL